MSGEVREFVDKLEREIVRQTEVNTCLYMAYVRFQQMYNELKEKTNEDVSHELKEDYPNPFDIKDPNDVFYDTDPESDIKSFIDSDGESGHIGSDDEKSDHEKSASSSASSDCVITGSSKATQGGSRQVMDLSNLSRTVYPAFQSLVNGPRVTAVAKKFAFYPKDKQSKRNILIGIYLDKMKSTNIYEVIKMMAIIHFNGLTVDRKFVPIPDHWPNPSKKEIKEAERQGNLEEGLDFHACVYLFHAVSYLFDLHQSVIPSLVAVSVLMKNARLQDEIELAAMKLPTIAIPRHVCKAMDCYTGHQILPEGQGVTCKYIELFASIR